MKKRITALLLLLTLSVTSLFACTSADKSESASDKTAKTSKSTSTKKQELTPVTLNEVAHSIFLCSACMWQSKRDILPTKESTFLS